MDIWILMIEPLYVNKCVGTGGGCSNKLIINRFRAQIKFVPSGEVTIGYCDKVAWSQMGLCPAGNFRARGGEISSYETRSHLQKDMKFCLRQIFIS